MPKIKVIGQPIDKNSSFAGPLLKLSWKPLQEKQVRESDPDPVADPGCFLGPAFKALSVPPNSPTSGVSSSDADPVIAI